LDKTHPDYVFSTGIAMRHTDAAGIVFFPRYYEMMHDAFEAFLGSRGLSPAQILKESTYFLPVVRCECEYRSPLFWGDPVDIQITVREIRRRSFTLGYRFVHGHKVYAAGATTHVTADKASKKSIALPEELLKALKG
jgi:YbgC/YbaW family acyl-CoA thioester hydrolase